MGFSAHLKALNNVLKKPDNPTQETGYNELLHITKSVNILQHSNIQCQILHPANKLQGIYVLMLTDQPRGRYLAIGTDFLAVKLEGTDFSSQYSLIN